MECDRHFTIWIRWRPLFPIPSPPLGWGRIPLFHEAQCPRVTEQKQTPPGRRALPKVSIVYPWRLLAEPSPLVACQGGGVCSLREAAVPNSGNWVGGSQTAFGSCPSPRAGSMVLTLLPLAIGDHAHHSCDQLPPWDHHHDNHQRSTWGTVTWGTVTCPRWRSQFPVPRSEAGLRIGNGDLPLM